ncbi:MAG TPA: metallophosphoesterase [Gaiellaceae bacterium]|nr:metallophosphoesterase [Gaiellaceae bacterium]
MSRVAIVHTADVHGNVDGLARAATLVERLRDESDAPVLFVDGGDVEETTTWISNATKGAAMHRLLSAAGCQAAVVGNAAWLRYGPQVLVDHAREAAYPLLLANVRAGDGSLIPGAQETVLVDAGGVRVGLIGITAPLDELDIIEEFGLSRLDEVELVQRLAADLRRAGADYVVLLSHLGLDVPASSVDDRRVVAALDGAVDAVIGGHTHDVLPGGEVIGGTVVSHVGRFAEHVGVLELGPDGARTRLAEVTDDVPLHRRVVEAAASVEPEIEAHLAEVIGELPHAMNEVEATRWLAGLLRRELDADLGLAAPGAAFSGPLPGGRLTRGALWRSCDSSGNPALVELRGSQLLTMLERGADSEFAAETPWTLRGRARGLLQADGPVDAIDPDATYRVAATDWELESYGGLVDEDWSLEPHYDLSMIMREFVERALNGARS